MELDRALGPQEPHWKEFRFDLTQIPAGEAVTAAEFRIYKLPSTHPLNRTLHVSMFEVVRERANRCLPCAQFLSSLGVCPAQPSGAHFPEDRRGASWEHTPEMRDAWPEARHPGERPSVSLGFKSLPCHPGCGTWNGPLSSQPISPSVHGTVTPLCGRDSERRHTGRPAQSRGGRRPTQGPPGGHWRHGGSCAGPQLIVLSCPQGV